MIISFAWTTPALVLGEKDTTRRDWSPRTIASARKIIAAGGTMDAYDKSPRFGGRLVGTIKPLELFEGEKSWLIDSIEWRREGFHVLQAIGAEIHGSTAADVWRFWLVENEEDQSVLRFEVDRLTAYGEKLKLIAWHALNDAGGPVKPPPVFMTAARLLR